MLADLLAHKRDDCLDSQFYNCFNGFWGCCWQDPCSEEEPVCPFDPSIYTSISVTIDPDDATSTSFVSSEATSGNGPPVTAEGPSMTTRTASSASAMPETTDGTSSTMISMTRSTWSTTSSTTDTPPTNTASSTPGISNSSSRISQGAVAGISIGAAVILLAMVCILILLIRRHKLSKRMPSCHDSTAKAYDDEKHDAHKNQTNSIGRGASDDVFAPFGGRATSFELSQPLRSPVPAHSSARSRKDFVVGSSRQSQLISPVSSYIDAPISPLNTSPAESRKLTRDRDTTNEEQASGPAHLDSKPIYFELDSEASQRPPLNASSTPASPVSTRGQASQDDDTAATAITHPSPLTPGFSSAVLRDATTQSLVRVPGGRAAVVTVGTGGQPGPRPTSSSSACLPRIGATLNATADELEEKRHVNSWDHL
ncbi:hypothetical protein BJ170DRAFT_469734 [Xylariales sp. AK1849]|nr:hypothetical protein BJ170DRAFT_469734 [Xylariales sp. AK1849]